MAGLLDSFLAGGNAGRVALENRRADADQSALRGLAPQIIAGNPQAYDQAAAISPQAAKAYQGAGDDQLRRLKGAIAFIDSQQSPEAKEGAYREVRPFLSRFGQEAPATFAEAMPKFEEAKARIAMLDASPTQGRVQSTYVDAAGNRVAIMADGTTQTLGQNAPNNQIIDTGNGFVGVNKGNLSAAPVMLGGQPATPQASGTPTLEPGQGQQQIEIIAQRANQMIAEGVPEAQVEAWAASQMGGGQASEGLAPAVSSPSGQQLRSAPKAPSTPAGYRTTASGGLEAIPGGPADIANAARADAAAARQAAEDLKTDQRRQEAMARQRESEDAANLLIRNIDSLMNTDGFDELGTAVGDLKLKTPLIRSGVKDADAQLRNIAGQVALSTMARLKSLSSSGATGFGALSAPELRLLENAIAALQAENISNEQLRKNLRLVRDTMQNTLNYSEPAQSAPSQSSDIDSLLDKYR